MATNPTGFAGYKSQILVGLAANRPSYPANGATVSADGTIVDAGFPVTYIATDTGQVSVYTTTLTSTEEGDTDGAEGFLEGTWTVIVQGQIKSLFSALPGATTVPVGTLAVVTDGAALTYTDGTTAAGSGSDIILVFNNGTNWVAT